MGKAIGEDQGRHLVAVRSQHTSQQSEDRMKTENSPKATGTQLSQSSEMNRIVRLSVDR